MMHSFDVLAAALVPLLVIFGGLALVDLIQQRYQSKIDKETTP